MLNFVNHKFQLYLMFDDTGTSVITSFFLLCANVSLWNDVVCYCLRMTGPHVRFKRTTWWLLFTSCSLFNLKKYGYTYWDACDLFFLSILSIYINCVHGINDSLVFQGKLLTRIAKYIWLVVTDMIQREPVDSLYRNRWI